MLPAALYVLLALLLATFSCQVAEVQAAFVIPPEWSQRDRRDYECWIGAANRISAHDSVFAAMSGLHVVRAAKEVCCAGPAREVLCSAHMSRCMSMDDNEDWANFCWPNYLGTRAARKVAECCEGDFVNIKKAKAPLWMLREIADDFAPWAGRKVTKEQLDRAERDFGDRLCRLRVTGKQLHIGTTPACQRRVFGPPVVRDVVAALDTLIGSDLLQREVDFLLLQPDFADDLPPDVPVFAQGSPRCQSGAILVPLNDCMGGLLEHLDIASPEARWAPAKSAKLIWRGALRPSTTCLAPGQAECRCRIHDFNANASELPRVPRYRLLELSRRYPRKVLAAAKIPDSVAPLVPPGLSGGEQDYNVDWGHYLFHASVDATAYNTLGNWRPLVLGRVLVKQASHIRVAWFRHGLRPFVHYLPVRFDLGDLIGRLSWARQNPNETERIRQRGLAFGRRYLSKCRLYARLHLLAALERYAELQDW